MSTQSQIDFVAWYGPAAIANQKAGGGPAEAILAQAALESGWGRHAPGNMFFGVKAGPSWKGKRQLLRTWEASKGDRPRLQEGESIIQHFPPGSEGNPFGGKHGWRIMAWFRAYATPLDSFQDHMRLLSSKRYEGVLQIKDPDRFADEVARRGYATDPNYASKLKSTIKLIREASKAIQKGAKASGPRPGASGGSGGGRPSTGTAGGMSVGTGLLILGAGFVTLKMLRR